MKPVPTIEVLRKAKRRIRRELDPWNVGYESASRDAGYDLGLTDSDMDPLHAALRRIATSLPIGQLTPMAVIDAAIAELEERP